MKAFISLIVPIVLLLTLSRDNQVNGECFRLVQQYYECKHLVMVEQENNETYIPSTMVPNNILNNAFYESLNLDEKTFDEAMDLFLQIYDETNNCNTDFCKCVSTGIINWYKYGKENKFSLYFRNATNYEQMKIIVSEFLEKFESTLKPYSELEMFFKAQTHSDQVLPTLAKFCMKYDYTDERYIYHEGFFDCFTDDITVHDCKFDVRVDKVNKTIKLKFTNPVMEKLMTCNLANAQNCPVETQKFHLLTSWAQEYPTFAWQGDSLTVYYDKLITDSHNIDPELKFIKSDLFTRANAVHVSNKYLQSSYDITSEIKAYLLASPNLYVECIWSKMSSDPSNKNYYISYYNLYSVYPETGASSGISFNTTLPESLPFTSSSSKNQRDPAGFNSAFFHNKEDYDQYEYYAMDIGDIYMHAFFNTTHFKLYLPDYQWAESSGVMVKGFNGFEPITTAQSTTKQTTQSTTESTEKPTTQIPTTANPFNSASRHSNISFTFISTFIFAFILYSK